MSAVSESSSRRGDRSAGAVIPAFLKKTYDILESDENSDYIAWDDTGASIIIIEVRETLLFKSMPHGVQPERFSNVVLPQYFKHSNYASFVRQLNMYGFHKESNDPNSRQFRHPLFRRGRRDLLPQIKRKAASSQRASKEEALTVRGTRVGVEQVCFRLCCIPPQVYM